MVRSAPIQSTEDSHPVGGPIWEEGILGRHPWTWSPLMVQLPSPGGQLYLLCHLKLLFHPLRGRSEAQGKAPSISRALYY